VPDKDIYYIIITPIDSNPVKARKLQIVGTLMQQAFLSLHVARHPILLKYGMEEETLKEWTRKTDHGEPSNP
jgi:hypothetical protein